MIVAEHTKPTTKRDCIDTWRSRGRIAVPNREGRIVDLLLVKLYETTAVNGIPLDVLIEARATHAGELTKFGLV